LSVTMIDALSAPASDGVKVIPIVQFPPATTEAPQVSAVSAKSPEFVPPIARLVMLNTALPVLLKERVCREPTVSMGKVPKLRLPGERTATGLAPVPERVTVCGLPPALSATFTAAVNDPMAAGVKVTLILHAAPAATLDPQLLVCEKSLGFAPARARLLMLKASLPVLVRVAVRVPLVVLTGWLPNERLLGERLTVATTPVPERGRDWGLPAALSVNVSAAASDPLTAGVKVTLILHAAPAATLDPQLLACEKSLGFEPVMAILRVKAALPELLRVTI